MAANNFKIPLKANKNGTTNANKPNQQNDVASLSDTTAYNPMNYFEEETIVNKPAAPKVTKHNNSAQPPKVTNDEISTNLKRRHVFGIFYDINI